MINCIYITPKKGGVCIPGKLLTWASYGIIQNTILIIFYPQSKTMDDSLNNRVLVRKVENEIKSDNYPIALTVRKKMQSFWKLLLEGRFISEEKYKRLTRSEAFDENELAGFIERQIVETRQATKIVADILKRAFPTSEIVYVKAGTISRFRQEFDLVKVVK